MYNIYNIKEKKEKSFIIKTFTFKFCDKRDSIIYGRGEI